LQPRLLSFCLALTGLTRSTGKGVGLEGGLPLADGNTATAQNRISRCSADDMIRPLRI